MPRYDHDLLHLLFRVLLEDFREHDWLELYERLDTSAFGKELREFPDELHFLHRLRREHPPHYRPRELYWILHRLEAHGQLRRFAEIVCEVRPDLTESLEAGELEPPLAAQAAPPPIILRRWWLYAFLLAGLVVGVMFSLFVWRGIAGLLFASQMLLLAVTACLTPTIAHRLTERWGRIARAALETILFTALLAGFGLWLFGAVAFGVWIVYAVALILLLEVGSHLIEHYKVVTLERLSRNVSFRGLQSDAEAIEKMFHSELALYIPVPVGLVVGTIFGLTRSQTPQATVVFCIQIVLLLASLVLVYFLLVAFLRMSDPLFKTSPVPSPRVSEENREGFLSGVGKVLRLLVPKPKSEREDQEKKDLDLACMVTNLRKLYLYDAVHNVILVVAFMAVVLSLWGVTVEAKWFIGGLLGLALLLNQLPYVIGQSLLHERVLERYEGVKRAEVAEKLKKYAPLFPSSDFLAALFMTGTAGGLVYFLLDQFVKNIFK